MTERERWATRSRFSPSRSIPRGGRFAIVNTDPATDLFLGRRFRRPKRCSAKSSRSCDPTPSVSSWSALGPVVANDAYASREVWARFRKDAYHSPRVVWGREVNLFLLGLAARISQSFDSSGQIRDATLEPFVQSLRDALEKTRAAVDSSGLEHSELWSYRIEDDRLIPSRYGTGSDVQLWSTTDLAVQFALSRLPPH